MPEMNSYMVKMLLLLCLKHMMVDGCQVTVAPPWEMKTFIPRGSSTYMNCTATSQDQTLRWSLQVFGSSSPVRLTPGAEDEINDLGFYSISQDDSETIILLINGTVNYVNRTIIKCSDAVSSFQTIDIYVTTLVVYEPTSIAFTSKQIEGQLINISWSPLPLTENAQTYNVTIKDSNKLQTLVQLSEPYFLFTAPEDAPPCEVYNFSVTATYVGATYTGAGCSVSSPVLSTMLPSLPDITPVESSIQYVLIKQVIKLIINVTFEPATYCGEYPPNNYTLDVKGQSSDVLSNSISPQMQSSIVIHNLTENTNYSFRVLVSNSVGVVSTKRRQFFTTDVRNVTVTPVENMDAFVVQCDFITGSNAQGCMVVLVGEFDNVTANVSNLEVNSSKVLTISHPLSCYHEIFAFDIESDGSVGTLAVPGVLTIGRVNTSSCLTTTTTDTSESGSTLGTSSLTLIISVTMSVLLLAAILSAMVVIIVYYKFGCHRKMSASSIQMTTNEVYGIATDDKEIVMKPNDVYGVSLSTLQ